MERVTIIKLGAEEACIPEDHFRKVFAVAVQVIAAAISPPDDQVVPLYVLPWDPDTICPLLEKVAHKAHVSHQTARIAVARATQAFSTTALALLVVKCPPESTPTN